MKKNKRTKSTRGRKPGLAVLSGIDPERETVDEIRLRIKYGSPEWRIVALRHYLKKNDSQLPSNYLSAPREVSSAPYAQRPEGVYPLWRDLCFEFEQAVLGGNADWFERQAKAIRKGGLPQRAQFNAKVFFLLEQAMWNTHSRRLRTAFKAGKFEKCNALTLTPAGKFTDATASKIYHALEKRELPNGHLNVEGWDFENKERAKDAIRELADHLQFNIKKRGRLLP